MRIDVRCRVQMNQRQSPGHPPKAHPLEYAARVAEVGALFIPVAQEAEGIKMSLELHVAAVELVRAVEGR